MTDDERLPLRWAEPPPRRQGRDWSDVLALLAERPGVWAVVAEHVGKGRQSRAVNDAVKLRKYECEVTTRSLNGATLVYARRGDTSESLKGET